MRRIAALILASVVLAGCAVTHRVASTSPAASGVYVLSPWPNVNPPPGGTPTQVSTAASGARASGTRVVAWPASPPSTAPGNANLAIVYLDNNYSAVVVRDVTNIDQPRTIATFPGPARAGPTFVGSNAVLMVPRDSCCPAEQLLLVPFAGTPQPLVEAYGYDLSFFKWSPDGSSMTFIADNYSYPSVFEWHLVVGGKDRLLATLPGWCGCDGSPDAGVWLDYSQDGRNMSFIEHGVAVVPAGVDLQVRAADGTLLTEIADATMPVWSGNKLYFRDSNGVEVWDSGRVSPFLPNVAWSYPQSSPAGGLIAYSAQDSNGIPHVYTVETATGRIRLLAAHGTYLPHFLNGRYVWYRGAKPCSPSCPFRDTFQDTGLTYILDLTTGAEVASRITVVLDTWPRGQ